MKWLMAIPVWSTPRDSLNRFNLVFSRCPYEESPFCVSLFFWSGRRGSNSLPGIPRMAVAIRRNPASPLDLTRSAPVEAASSSSPSVKFQKKTPSFRMGSSFGAGDEARTRYLDLGKVALYQMSYARKRHRYCSAYGASGRGRTGDTRIFSPLLYQLSYRGKWRPRRGSNPRPPA